MITKYVSGAIHETDRAPISISTSTPCTFDEADRLGTRKDEASVVDMVVGCEYPLMVYPSESSKLKVNVLVGAVVLGLWMVEIQN